MVVDSGKRRGGGGGGVGEVDDTITVFDWGVSGSGLLLNDVKLTDACSFSTEVTAALTPLLRRSTCFIRRPCLLPALTPSARPFVLALGC